jgi:signal transduction histidine kinase
MADTERRYLNIALSEINQMRLNLDAKIMADRSEQRREPIQDDGESFSINSVAKVVEAELKRLGSDENIETRVLLDDSLKIDIRGSAYWVESALLAFINASLAFSDEGFVELSLWTETSRSGEPELLARIRDAGVEWSLDDPALNHASITVLKTILDGLGATSFSSAASIAGSQEHLIRFKSA